MEGCFPLERCEIKKRIGREVGRSIRVLVSYMRLGVLLAEEGYETPLPEITRSTFPNDWKVQVSTPSKCNDKVSTWEKGLPVARYPNAK